MTHTIIKPKHITDIAVQITIRMSKKNSENALNFHVKIATGKILYCPSLG
jgi:hypothetical protein